MSEAKIAALHTARAFSGAGDLILASEIDFGVFHGLNAATHALSDNYEVFQITKANATHLSGAIYFSTWLADGKTHVEECSVFIDYVSSRQVYLPNTL